MEFKDIEKSLVNEHNIRKNQLPSFGLKQNYSENSKLETELSKTSLFEYKQLLDKKRIEKSNTLISAEWNTDINEARVIKNSGSHLQIFGHNRNGYTFLYPEETLFLLEMNNLQLFYNNVRLSIQRSYGILLDSVNGISVNEYRIYKHFVIHGYRLFRHGYITDSGTSAKRTDGEISVEISKAQPSCSFVENKFEENNCSKSEITKVCNKESLLSDVVEEVFKKLDIFKCIRTDHYSCENILKISYDVYLPNTELKKTNRPEPHYKLIILKTDENIWTLIRTQTALYKSIPLIFASVIGNSISVVSLQNVSIPLIY